MEILGKPVVRGPVNRPPEKRMNRTSFPSFTIFLVLVFAASVFAQPTQSTPPPAQTPPPAAEQATPPPVPTYTPKFKGDPARSDSEAAAVAYMRVVIRANRAFNKQYDHFALTLNELVHSGTFTKRMVNPDRGDYTASYKGKKDSYVLTMTPKAMDAQHRSFYAEDDGKIHADETKAADADSPILK
jgi:hypothetical protein